MVKKNRTLALVIVTYLFSVFLSGIVNQICRLELCVVLIILSHWIMTSIFILGSHLRYSKLIYFGFLFRTSIYLWDLLGKNIFKIIGSGMDSEQFYITSLNVMSNMRLLYERNIYGGIFTKLLAVIGYVGVKNRFFIQYFILVIGVLIMFMQLQIINESFSNSRFNNIGIIILLFQPISIINSAILLRENFLVLLSLVSFKYFLKFEEKEKILYFILAIIYILIAMSLHTGYISFLIGYFIHIINRKNRKIKITSLVIFFFMYYFLVNTSVGATIMFKFNQLNQKDIYQVTSEASFGRASYLDNVRIDGLFSLLKWLPIKIIYFYLSPLPWQWRGTSDMIAFILDSIFYIAIFYKILKLKSNNDEYKYDKLLLTIFISFSVIFGIGISNFGTAMRHRNKIIFVLILMTGEKKEKIDEDLVY